MQLHFSVEAKIITLSDVGLHGNRGNIYDNYKGWRIKEPKHGKVSVLT